MRNLRASLIDVLNAALDLISSTGHFSAAPTILSTSSPAMLRNAAISTVTLFGLHIGTLVGGAVITETVFGIPGAGRLMVDSIFGRDYQVVQGLTLTLAVVVSLVFLAVDIVQAAIEPAIRIRVMALPTLSRARSTTGSGVMHSCIGVSSDLPCESTRRNRSRSARAASVSSMAAPRRWLRCGRRSGS